MAQQLDLQANHIVIVLISLYCSTGGTANNDGNLNTCFSNVTRGSRGPVGRAEDRRSRVWDSIPYTGHE